MKIRGTATKWAKNPHRAEEIPLTRVAAMSYYFETGDAPMGVMISFHVGPEFDGTSMLVRMGHHDAKHFALRLLKEIGASAPNVAGVHDANTCPNCTADTKCSKAGPEIAGRLDTSREVLVSVAEQQSDSDCSIENPEGEVTAVRVTRPDSKPVAFYVDDRHVTTVQWKKG